jgi:hypothetical protein
MILGVPISGEILREKAQLFYSQTHNDDNFKASSGWLDKFKNRYGIRQLSITGEKLSSDVAAVEPFKNVLRNKIKEMQLCPDQIYNADESGLFWKLLPQRTLVHQAEASAPGRKMSKERITFMPCCNASGTHKMRLLVLGKSQKPRAFGSEPLPVTYKGQKKAWITKEIFKDWFYTDFVPTVRKRMQQLNLDAKALLILDNAPGHPQDLCSDDNKIVVMFLPPNVTPLVQPMDQNVIQAVKLHYRKGLLKRIVASENADISAELKKVNLKDVVVGLAKAWENVRPELIQKSWGKLLTPVDDGWSEDDDLPLSQWRDKIELAGIEKQIKEVTELIKHISGDVTRQEIIEWAVGQEESWESINDMDILEHVQNESSSDEEEEVIPGRVKHTEALRSFETCLKWAEENGESEHHILILSEMRKRAEKAEEATIKQSKITDFFPAS